MIKLDSILKNRDITFPTNFHIVKVMILPVVLYGCESWTIKKAQHWRTGAFKLWCGRRFLRIPWTARRSNLNPVNPKVNRLWIFIERTIVESEAPILWIPDTKGWLTGKDLMLGRPEGKRRMRWQKTKWLDSITDFSLCFAFLQIFFFGMVLITVSFVMLQISIHNSSGTSPFFQI